MIVRSNAQMGFSLGLLSASTLVFRFSIIHPFP
jgi:hypothetical protein